MEIFSGARGIGELRFKELEGLRRDGWDLYLAIASKEARVSTKRARIRHYVDSTNRRQLDVFTLTIWIGSGYVLALSTLWYQAIWISDKFEASKNYSATILPSIILNIEFSSIYESSLHDQEWRQPWM